MLVDSVTITVIAGNGGNGVATFRKDAMTANGGPDGGDGGNGGNIYIQGSTNLNDLREFRYKKTIQAQRGIDGKRHNGFGKNADHMLIFVPIGTEISDVDTNEHIEILNTKEKILIAHGGVGGRGNVFFKTATNQAPRQKETGGTGQRRVIHLELKIIAQIGLIGLPNAGKSSLLSVLTNAQPTIGDYPFTTLEPNIGMMGSYAIADIPGLIEGASTGKGLGTKFLKHIEKTKILVHCIDCTNDNLKQAYETVRNEFRQFNPVLLEKPEIIFLNKTDLINTKEIKKATALLKKLNKPIIAGSTRNPSTIDMIKTTCTAMLSGQST